MLQVQQPALLDSLALLPVPAGTAIIGLDEALAAKFTNSYGEAWREFYYRETPQHTVEVAAFELAKYPVTNGLYAGFIAAGGYENAEWWTPEGWAWRSDTRRIAPRLWDDPRYIGAERPVIGVSWFEAMAYSAWASSVTGRALRLPSEVEWEWAARAQNTRWMYPWGGTFNADLLNSGVAGISGTTPGTTIAVGSHSPKGNGPFGHGDQLGQVWEWTRSAFKPYPYIADDGREDPYSPERHVLRGGSWGDGKYANRVTTRYHYPGHYGDVTSGFRVAASVENSSPAPRPHYDLVIYGRASFCSDLIDTKRWLRAWKVPYRQLNIDLDERAGDRLDGWLAGIHSIPTLVIAERGAIDPVQAPAEADLRNLRNADRGTMMHEPEEDGLRAFLIRNGLLDAV